ncbi:uncharacterized protein BHQ10_003064 [Talaromyces amestolkiae]|uniref:Major facilitator superfamily (MFS) profile domain-containing protein n=1 Tax=Talaromyces amestolkiae TaxID=1196081 RepID=A0A364KU22_TALAM|nr:uncharacterized protein BHQ10_003064 [Talaromyces amestolkiae]RAO67052.1 hypothetical protein BHQ10_003064 [Talaromyces amestolkiae]
MYGYDSAFIGTTLTLPSFKHAFGLDTASSTAVASLSSNIVSTFQGGAFFGSLFAFFLAERFGRKPTLLVAGVVFTIGVILQMIGHLGLLYGGRALTGLGVGSSAMILPIYIAECSPAAIRGRLVGVFEVMLQIALVFGFWVNYGVNKNISPIGNTQWRIPVGVQFVPAGLLLICLSFMPESPRWLASKGKRTRALRCLSWIRHLPETHAYVQQELLIMEAGAQQEIEETGEGWRHWVQLLRELGQKGVRNRLIISVLVMLSQNFTGINAINYYSPTIFKSIGFTGTSVQLLATGVYGLVKMGATFVFVAVIVDRIGRRPGLLVGSIGAGFAMFYLAIYSKVSNSLHATPPRDAGANAAVAMVYIYAVFYGLSWNAIPWLFTAETLPTRVRTMGMAISVCSQWLGQFIVVYSLPHMITGIGYGTFLFFACCTVLAFVFAYLFVPETKGVAMEDMHLIFGPDVSILATKARKNYDTHREDRLEAVIVREKIDVEQVETV